MSVSVTSQDGKVWVRSNSTESNSSFNKKKQFIANCRWYCQTAHTVWKNQNFTLTWKIFREIKFPLFKYDLYAKPRIRFLQKIVRVKFRNFHTVYHGLSLFLVNVSPVCVEDDGVAFFQGHQFWYKNIFLLNPHSVEKRKKYSHLKSFFVKSISWFIIWFHEIFCERTAVRVSFRNFHILIYCVKIHEFFCWLDFTWNQFSWF